MRFISGIAGTVVLLATAASALAGGFGSGFFGGAPQAIGVGAYAPGQGPVGTRGFYGGNFPGHQNAFGFWGGYGGGYGGGAGGDNYVVPGGNTTVNSYYNYDARPRDGGFYGGGGVFYGDNGYSRVYSQRASDEYCPPRYEYRPAQHVYDISPARRHSRHSPRY